MENNKREFLGTLCNLYMTVILAVVPLYTGGTYYFIGDTKYWLFRNVSFICLGLWLLTVLVSVLWRGIRDVLEGGLTLRRMRCIFLKSMENLRRVGKNPLDFFMAAYGICVLLSALHSPYGSTPWLGYQDWHMGALSQLLFIGIYFFMARNYDGSAYPVYLGEAALFAVTVLAFANRLGWDPLGLLAPFNSGDWEYSHMVSTVGNINWLCGYLGVAVAFPISGYLNSQRWGKGCILFLLSVLSVTLLALQGSDIGLVMAAACVGMCLLTGCLGHFRHRMREFFEKGIILAAAVLLLISVMGWLTGFLGTWAAMPSDSPMQGRLTHPAGWAAISLAMFGLFLLLRKLPARMGKIMRNTFLALGCLTVGGLVIRYLMRLPAGGSWGSGRGGLWSAAWKGFLLAEPLQKLLGAGPDCFAEYIYSIMPAEEVYGIEGRWQEAIFANAHNEWLNQLVNVGVLGTVSYLGIFLYALKRYRGMLLGIVALVLYGINSLTGFQQVLNTPLLFLVLGLCESRVRQADYYQDV